MYKNLSGYAKKYGVEQEKNYFLPFL